ncbi:MAG: rhomboid family intramembrane serine protease [Bacteroidetes bacterium CG_4_10_14_3_um_filter_31_20]|nr:rhomboid family intramembrane serine protease [Bacteroidota bacterium]PIY02869.1 MAG: rhomboid family intramembrane serine protease [Bacteroidetes bacterium CG_4_10_14_3_um_filter_31_20]
MNFEKKKLFLSLFFPCIFVGLLWLIKIYEITLNEDFSSFGLYPLKLKGIIGIFSAPLIHGNIEHLYANTIPLLVLGTFLFYFYSKVSYKVFFLIYIMTGIWVWFGGRPSYHIGASGIVYGLAGYIFTSGIILKNIRLLSISLLVVFLYGSMFWGIFPFDPKISWESHLLGLIAGIILAIYYKNESSFLNNKDENIIEEDDDNTNTDWQNPEYFESNKKNKEI